MKRGISGYRYEVRFTTLFVFQGSLYIVGGNVGEGGYFHVYTSWVSCIKGIYRQKEEKEEGSVIFIMFKLIVVQQEGLLQEKL